MVIINEIGEYSRANNAKLTHQHNEHNRVLFDRCSQMESGLVVLYCRVASRRNVFAVYPTRNRYYKSCVAANSEPNKLHKSGSIFSQSFAVPAELMVVVKAPSRRFLGVYVRVPARVLRVYSLTFRITTHYRGSHCGPGELYRARF